MPNEAPVAPTQTPQSAPAATTTAPTDGGPAATPKTYTEAEYQTLSTELNEYKRQIQNAVGFIEADPEVKQRLELYGKSFELKKPYTEMIKELEAKKAPQTPAEKKPEGLSEAQIRDMIRNEFQTSSQPFLEAQASANLKETKENILKGNNWATDKDWETFEGRVNEYATQKAQELMQANWPRMNQKQAWDKAVGDLANVSDELLWDHFMKAEREEAILGKRRQAPRLPDGMVERLTTGKDADVLEKARKAYKAIEGDGDKVAALVAEYAPQLGIDPKDKKGVEKIYAMISKE